MKLDTVRAKQIDAYLKNKNPESGEKKRVELSGQIHVLDVFRIPLKCLIFNIRNGRFAAELLAKEEQLKRRLDATDAEDAKIIQKLLLDQNENETAALKEDLKLHGQLEAGIITFDGAVINANRRMAILLQLFHETSEPKFEYLKVARLPRDVDEKDLWRIEAGLQFAKDFRLEYGPVNELLKLKEGRDRGLTPEDISRSLLGRYSPNKVKEKLEVLKLIEEYLIFIGRKGEYYHVQDERNVEKFNSLQSHVIAALKRQNKKESEVAKLIIVAFTMIEKTNLTHWDVRKLGKIANIDDAKKEIFKVYDTKNPLKRSPAEVTEAFKSADEIVEDREEKDKPERLIKKALSAIKSINPKNSKLQDANLKALLQDLASHISKLLKGQK